VPFGNVVHFNAIKNPAPARFARSRSGAALHVFFKKHLYENKLPSVAKFQSKAALQSINQSWMF